MAGNTESEKPFHLEDVAQRIEPRSSWEDLPLPQDQVSRLKEICGHVKQCDQGFSDEGSEITTDIGRGLCVLFSGPSGTGKTTAAGVIANELELSVYRIDLSSVVNKYIRETEKNLKKVFDAAEETNVILFFDEADSLFGKRSDVSDSHDRYANLEANYLLSRIEEHRGLVVLATNRRENIDEAFIRRIQYFIEFPIPDDEQRKGFWEAIWEWIRSLFKFS